MYYKKIEGVDEQGNPTHYFLEMPTVDMAMKFLKIVDKKHPDIHLLTKLFYDHDYEDDKTNLESATPVQSHDFIGIVLEDSKDGKVLIEMRNKFVKGDELEILSPGEAFNEKFIVDRVEDEDGEIVEVINKVQSKVYIYTDKQLLKNDILRRKVG